MIIKPIELANICSLFPALKTGRILPDNLRKLAQDSKLIDSENTVDRIIEEAVNSGLIALEVGFYVLTKNGKRICKYHRQPVCQLATPTKEIFIKYVFLNVESNNWCCSEFIGHFNGVNCQANVPVAFFGAAGKNLQFFSLNFKTLIA